MAIRISLFTSLYEKDKSLFNQSLKCNLFIWISLFDRHNCMVSGCDHRWLRVFVRLFAYKMFHYFLYQMRKRARINKNMKKLCHYDHIYSGDTFGLLFYQLCICIHRCRHSCCCSHRSSHLAIWILLLFYLTFFLFFCVFFFFSLVR